MIQEINEQKAKDNSNAEEEIANDIIEEFFSDCGEDYPEPSDK